jgi:toxin ParE1/3/4
MSPYSLSEAAQADLDEIWDYYKNAEDESVVERQFASLRYFFQLIADHPRMGRSRPEYRLGVRSFPVRNPPYVILYVPYEGHVEITRVLHGSRDIDRLFDSPAD